MKALRLLCGLALVFWAQIAIAQTPTTTRGQRDDTSVVTCAENSQCVDRITANRAKHVNLRDASGTELGTVASPLNVTGSVTTTGGAVAGDVAHDAVDSGNPVKIGGKAYTANPTAVSSLDRTNAIFDKLGKQITVGAIRELKGIETTTITSSTAETTIVTAVASTFLDVYSLVITNTSATKTMVTIKDATAGTTRYVIEAPADTTVGFTLPVDSAVPQAAVNNNWTATCADSIDSVVITALYVKNL